MTLLSKPSISMEDVRNTIDTYIKGLSDELYTLNKQKSLFKSSKLKLIFLTFLNDKATSFNEALTTYLHPSSLYMAPKADASTLMRSMMPFPALAMLVVTT
ncbi:hypothetical protein LB505_011639 [Fusarium chuoi]|nr:hypothetical protein LB505_011639 [Fusarium chuoi]